MTRERTIETNPNLLALPAAMRGLASSLGQSGYTGDIGKALLAASLKDTRPSSVKEIEYLRGQIDILPAGSPKRAAFEKRLQKVTSPASGTTVNLKTGENISGKIVNRWFESDDAGQEARKIYAKMSRLEQLLGDGLQTGFGAETFLTINRALKAAGLTDKDVSNEEEALALITTEAISGAKELGVNPTDKDLEMIFQRGVQLKNTPKGNRMIIKYRKEIAQRNIERAEWLDNFVANNATLLDASPTQFEIKRRREMKALEEKFKAQNARIIEESGVTLTSGSSPGSTGGFGVQIHE